MKPITCKILARKGPEQTQIAHCCTYEDGYLGRWSPVHATQHPLALARKAHTMETKRILETTVAQSLLADNV